MNTLLSGITGPRPIKYDLSKRVIPGYPGLSRVVVASNDKIKNHLRYRLRRTITIIIIVQESSR